MAIAQHLPCLGTLLRVSGQRSHPSLSYRSTHRSTLSSQSSDLSWISGRKRQESLGSESEVVSLPSVGTSPFLSQPALGTWTWVTEPHIRLGDTGFLTSTAWPSVASRNTQDREKMGGLKLPSSKIV